LLKPRIIDIVSSADRHTHKKKILFGFFAFMSFEDGIKRLQNNFCLHDLFLEKFLVFKSKFGVFFDIQIFLSPRVSVFSNPSIINFHI